MQKKLKVASTALGCLLTLLCTEGIGQSFLHLPTQKEIWFDSIVGVENSGIVNGPEYKVSVRGKNTHPFFLTGETSGKVIIQGQEYTAPLMYDVYANALVLKHISSSGSAWFVELEKEKVTAFEIFDHTFKNFEGKGFYDVLLEAPTLTLVVERTKKVVIKDRTMKYNTVDYFYLIDNKKWRPLRNKASITRLVDTKEKVRALKKFIRGEKIRTKGSFNEKNLIKILAYCETLRNPSR